jgi:hypothetical protein
LCIPQIHICWEVSSSMFTANGYGVLAIGVFTVSTPVVYVVVLMFVLVYTTDANSILAADVAVPYVHLRVVSLVISTCLS